MESEDPSLFPVQEPSNVIQKRKVGETAAEAITPIAGDAGGNLGDNTDVIKPALESNKDCARVALMQKLPQEVLVDITDIDYDNLGRHGFTSCFSFESADKEDLNFVFRGRPGLVASILKAYGTPQLPLVTEVYTEGQPSLKKAKWSRNELESSDVVSKVNAENDYFRKLLEAPNELPKSIEQLQNFLSERKLKLLVLDSET